MSEHEARAGCGKAAGLTLQGKLVLWGFGLGFVIAVFHYLGPILAPFVAGIVLGYLLDPVADRLERIGLSRLGAALLILTVFLFVLTAVVILLAPPLSRQLVVFIDSLPGYLTTLQGLIVRMGEKLTGEFLNVVYQTLGLEPANLAVDLQKYLSDFTGEAARWTGTFLRSLVSGGAAVINVVSLIVITPVVAFYMLLDWDRMTATLDSLVPPRHRADVRAVAGDIDKALSGFLRGQALVCLFLGLWYAIGLSLIGLNFGFLIGVTAGVLSFIPFVGSLTAFVLSIIVAIVQGWPDWRLPLMAIGVVSAGLFLDGNVLSPRLVGGSIGLHPVWLMFALLAFGAVFGFLGLLVAAPVAAAVGVILRFAARRYRESALYVSGAGTERGGA